MNVDISSQKINGQAVSEVSAPPDTSRDDAMVGSCQPSENQIRRGAQEFALIEKERSHTWDRWKHVITAILLIDALAMRSAKTNAPRGGKFNRAVRDFLRCYGLDRIHKSDRSRMRKFAGKLEEIDAWRAEQPAESQLELNHPRIVYDRWKRSTAVKSDEPAGNASGSEPETPDPVASAVAALEALTDTQLTAVWTAFTLAPFLRTIPADMRSELERRIAGLRSVTKDAGPVLLRESEILRQAVSQMRIATALNTAPADITRAEEQALLALRMFTKVLAKLDIDRITVTDVYAKAARCAENRRSTKKTRRAA